MTPREYIPLPHQPQMLEHLVRNKDALLLAEMGLGKSVVVLKHVSDLLADGAIKGCLIVSPLRTKLLTWTEQCATWEHSAWMRVVDMSTPEGEKAWNEGSADIYLIHYDVLASRNITRTVKGKSKTTHHPGFCEKFMQGRKDMPVDVVVYDEVSKFKAHNGKNSKAIRAFHRMFTHHIGMSGTPLGNSRLNLFNQVRMIDGGERLGVSFTHFRDVYALSDFMGYVWTMREGACEQIDRKISDISLVLLCADHANLPPCYVEDIEVTLPHDAERYYRKMEKELLLELEKGDIVALNAAVLANKVLQICGGACYNEYHEVQVIHDAKIEALKKLRKKLGPKEPMLVLTAFKHESARLLTAIPGSRAFDVKDIDAWRAGKIHTGISDARKLSHGLDGLQTSCCNLVWFTPHWSAETTQQTIKRIHRMGNKRDTYVWRLVAKISGHVTMDEIVIESNRLHAEEQDSMFSALKKLQQLAKQ